MCKKLKKHKPFLFKAKFFNLPFFLQATYFVVEKLLSKDLFT